VITGTTRATPVLLWSRAALLALVVVAASVIGHVSADGLLPGPLALLGLLVTATVVSARFLTRQASAPRLVALLVSGQVVVHGVLSLLAGHGSSATPHVGAGEGASTGAGASAGGAGFVFDGRQAERAGSYFDQVSAMQPTGVPTVRSGPSGSAAGDHGSALTHLVEHLGTQSLAMMLAHLAVVALLGVWLAVGERALWTVLTLSTTRLADLVSSAGAVLLGRWSAVLLQHVRPAPSLATTGRSAVPLPQLLHHVVAHRGPPALLAA
jgi:hypothetical protein